MAPCRSVPRRTGRSTVRCLAGKDAYGFDGYRDSLFPGSRGVVLPSQPVAASLGANVRQCDFLVIGSGIAGLSYALKVAQYGSVAVVTKDYANESCTQYAQGGVCAVLDKSDSVENHVKDTMVAGAWLNDPQ